MGNSCAVVLAHPGLRIRVFATRFSLSRGVPGVSRPSPSVAPTPGHVWLPPMLPAVLRGALAALYESTVPADGRKQL